MHLKTRTVKRPGERGNNGDVHTSLTMQDWQWHMLVMLITCTVSFSPTHKRHAAGYAQDNHVRTYKMRKGACSIRDDCAPAPIMRACFSPRQALMSHLIFVYSSVFSDGFGFWTLHVACATGYVHFNMGAPRIHVLDTCAACTKTCHLLSFSDHLYAGR